MSKQYFVEVVTFSPRNEKCRRLQEWAKNYHHVIITTEREEDNAFARFLAYIKSECKSLDGRFKSTNPFIVQSYGLQQISVATSKATGYSDYTTCRFCISRINAGVKFLGKDKGIAVLPLSEEGGGGV